MGTATLMSAISMIQLSSITIFIPLAFSLPPPPEYPTPAPTQQYNPDLGQTNVGGYGVNKDPYCHMVEKVVFENQCEPYVEKTCYTQNKESCVTKQFNNCTGVIETNIERVCFDVNELVATWWRRSTTRPWRRPIKFRGVSLARTECATPPTR